jgi:transmembrane sensor
MPAGLFSVRNRILPAGVNPSYTSPHQYINCGTLHHISLFVYHREKHIFKMLEDKYKEAIKKAENLHSCDLIDQEGMISDPYKVDYSKRNQFIKNIHVEKAWIRFFFKANRAVLTYSVSAAAAIIIAFFVFKAEQPEPDTFAQLQIMPADGAVSLRLSSGELISVDPDNLITGRLEGASVDEQNNMISYQASPEKTMMQDDISVNGVLPETMYHELIIPKGRTFSLAMNDGTKVWINSESKLRYPVTFNGDNRTVYLEGEAFFDVFADPNSTFAVITSEYQVIVTGTRFNVKSYTEEEIVATTLVSGAVVIPGASGEERNMIPGQQFRLSKLDGTSTVEMVDTDLYTAWINNRLRMSGTSLVDITNQLQRRYDVRFVFDSDSSKDMLFTGVIPLNENLHIILGQLSKVSDVHFEHADNHIAIRSK